MHPLRCEAQLSDKDGSDTSSPPSSPTLDERTLPDPNKHVDADSWLALDAEIRAEAAKPWADDHALPTTPTISIDRIRFELFPVGLLSEIVPPRTVGAAWASRVVSEWPRPPWYAVVFRSPSPSKTFRTAADRRVTVWTRPAAHGRFLRSMATVDEM